jgi:small subunit ribosomal protein S1
MQTQKQYSPSREEFEALLKEAHKDQEAFEGRVVEGKVVALEGDFALVDVGLKSEGRIPLREFRAPGGPAEVKIGDTLEVYVDRIENAQGEAQLSRERARREESWGVLEKSFKSEEPVEGHIFGRVKGGFTVDLSGAVAFLPGSQLDVRPMRDPGALMNTPLKFQILKMDRKRGNIVVSRRALLEEARAEQRSELLKNLAEGQVIKGIVKNITEYGAFIDLGGVDGLLHLTDMAWSRLNHPTEILKVGDQLDVKIIRINPESQRISLGLKQLGDDPWLDVAKKYKAGDIVKGRVTNVTDYGAFVELENGIEGLVHVSEMSWTKKNLHPSKIVSTSQEIEVKVLEVDPDKRRVSLGLKQCLENPWAAFAKSHKAGTRVEGKVKNTTEFGLFIGVTDELDGMVHLSDLDWEKPGEEAIKAYKKGDTVKAVILDVDGEKERISLGIKQLKSDPFAAISQRRKGEVVTGTVTKVLGGGVEVAIGDTGMTGFIRKNDLSRDRNDQRPDRFAVGQKVDAQVLNVDKNSRKVQLSIKAHEIAEEKAAVAQYGSSDSGASLGEILGAALKKSKAGTGTEETEKPAQAKAAKKPAAKKAAAKKAPKKAAKKAAK